MYCRIIRSGNFPQSGDFKDSVFNGDGVKTQLLHDQHQKCAYCEVNMAGDYGAVEHYRPKTGWQENKNDILHKPGYYWLAYEWTNLLCSCDRCNSTARKGNLFPLRNSVSRDIDNQNVSREEPLIINPIFEDPGDFLRFNKYMAVPAINNGSESDKGRTTIDVFDLNGCNSTKTTPARINLLESRKREWIKAKALYDKCVSNGMGRDEAIDFVKSVHAESKNQFSGMFINQNMWFWTDIVMLS